MYPCRRSVNLSQRPLEAEYELRSDTLLSLHVIEQRRRFLRAPKLHYDDLSSGASICGFDSTLARESPARSFEGLRRSRGLKLSEVYVGTYEKRYVSAQRQPLAWVSHRAPMASVSTEERTRRLTVTLLFSHFAHIYPVHNGRP